MASTFKNEIFLNQASYSKLATSVDTVCKKGSDRELFALISLIRKCQGSTYLMCFPLTTSRNIVLRKDLTKIWRFEPFDPRAILREKKVD